MVGWTYKRVLKIKITFKKPNEVKLNLPNGNIIKTNKFYEMFPKRPQNKSNEY